MIPEIKKKSIDISYFWHWKVGELLSMNKLHNFHFIGIFPMFESAEETGSFLKGKGISNLRELLFYIKYVLKF